MLAEMRSHQRARSETIPNREFQEFTWRPLNGVGCAKVPVAADYELALAILVRFAAEGVIGHSRKGNVIK